MRQRPNTKAPNRTMQSAAEESRNYKAESRERGVATSHLASQLPLRCNQIQLTIYVFRTNILSRANCCFGWRGCIFDLCRFADQTKYARSRAGRAQLHDGAMDGDSHGDSQKP